MISMVPGVRCESNETMRSISDQLRMKRDETPTDGYMDDFIKEFHRRQRVAASRSRPWEFAGLLNNWFRDMKPAIWVFVAGLGYACFMTWLLVTPSAEEKQRGALPKRVHTPEPVFLKPAKQISPDHGKPDNHIEAVKADTTNPF